MKRVKPSRHERLFQQFLDGFEKPITGDAYVMMDEQGSLSYEFRHGIRSVSDDIGPGDLVSRASSSGKKEACVAAVAVVRDMKRKDEHVADVALVVPTGGRLYQIWNFCVISGSIVFVLVLACLFVLDFVLMLVLVLVLVRRQHLLCTL